MTTNPKSYREDVTPAQADERRRALAALLRAAGRAVDCRGQEGSLDALEAALRRMDAAHAVRKACFPVRRNPAEILHAQGLDR